MNGIFHPIRMVQRFYEAWQSALMKREIQGPAEWAEPWPSSPVCRWLLAQSSSSTGVCEVRGQVPRESCYGLKTRVRRVLGAWASRVPGALEITGGRPSRPLFCLQSVWPGLGDHPERSRWARVHHGARRPLHQRLLSHRRLVWQGLAASGHAVHPGPVWGDAGVHGPVQNPQQDQVRAAGGGRVTWNDTWPAFCH